MTKYLTLRATPQKRSELSESVWSASTRSAVVVAVLALSFVYVIQTSAVSVTGYDLGDLQKERNDLHDEHDRIQVEIAGYRSMQSIEDRLATLALEPARDVVYVTAVGRSVARR